MGIRVDTGNKTETTSYELILQTQPCVLGTWNTVYSTDRLLMRKMKLEEIQKDAAKKIKRTRNLPPKEKLKGLRMILQQGWVRPQMQSF